MKKTSNSKKLKIHIKFNDGISKEEEDRIWFRVFDLLLDRDNKNKHKLRPRRDSNTQLSR